MAEIISISVVYALPDRQVVVPLQVPVGTSVEQAVERSGLLREFPDITTRPLHCAIYARPVQLSQLVRAADRIEILRPLLIDPKESRRQAAAKSKRPR